MIRNIIFDMGGVLLDYIPTRTAETFTENPEDAELLLKEIFLSNEWALLDQGMIEEEAAIQAMCSRLPERLWDACRRAMDEWDKDLTPVEGALELVQELKTKGYHLYLCSNTSTRFHTFCKRYPVFELLDGMVTSADEKCVKPNPGIFQALIQRYALVPGECLFIDDRSENVEAGVALGMTGIVCNGKMRHLRQSLMLRGIGVRAE